MDCLNKSTENGIVCKRDWVADDDIAITIIIVQRKERENIPQVPPKQSLTLLWQWKEWTTTYNNKRKKVLNYRWDEMCD